MFFGCASHARFRGQKAFNASMLCRWLWHILPLHHTICSYSSHTPGNKLKLNNSLSIQKHSTRCEPHTLASHCFSIHKHFATQSLTLCQALPAPHAIMTSTHHDRPWWNHACTVSPLNSLPLASLNLGLQPNAMHPSPRNTIPATTTRACPPVSAPTGNNRCNNGTSSTPPPPMPSSHPDLHTIYSSGLTPQPHPPPSSLTRPSQHWGMK